MNSIPGVFAKKKPAKKWIGVDLDGTLAKRNGGAGKPIGEPVPAMVARVEKWLKDGKEVRIFTARAGDPQEVQRIRTWLSEHDLPKLAITNKKDLGMVEQWCDRAIRVEVDKGTPCRTCAGVAIMGKFTTDEDQAAPLDCL